MTATQSPAMRNPVFAPAALIVLLAVALALSLLHGAGSGRLPAPSVAAQLHAQHLPLAPGQFEATGVPELPSPDAACALGCAGFVKPAAAPDATMPAPHARRLATAAAETFRAGLRPRPATHPPRRLGHV